MALGPCGGLVGRTGRRWVPRTSSALTAHTMARTTSSDTHAAHPPREGDTAPELSLPTLDDERFALADREGRAVVVSFLRHAG